MHQIPKILALSLLATAAACSGRVEEAVSYDVYRTPVAGFQTLTFLGVAKVKDLDPKLTDYLQTEIQRCGQYQKVNKLDKVFPLPDGDREAVEKSLRKDIDAFQDSRYVHGVLVVEPFKRKVSRDTAPTKFVAVRESVDHDWFDSYGYAAAPRDALFGSEEIGPKLKFETKRISTKHTTWEIGLRYALYNKNKNSLVFDKKTYIGASLTTYSPKPAVGDKNAEAAMLRHLMNRVVRNVCPRIATAERTLYAAGDQSKADQLTVQGVELAGNGEWESAADMWKKSILMDKRGAYAYHDLGVYYERAGNVPAAMEEFEKAKRAGVKAYAPKQYDVSLDIFRPRYEPLGMEPRLYAVSGAGWVSIYGGKKNALKVGAEYPVYRMRRLGEGPEYRFDGVDLTEMGRVRVVKHEPPFVLARITQFVDPGRVEAGDVIVTQSP